MPTEHYVLGLMSGSSLDGVDLAICRFHLADDAASVADWGIVAATTEPLPPPWRARLRSAPHLPGAELWRLHADLGHWYGRRARAFLDQHPNLPVQLAGSHGHTVFHDPTAGYTCQIGDGAALAHRLGLPVVTELRGGDVAAGGQGAPLAPLADHWLFGNYAGWLNLGGIANLTVRTPGGSYLAGDVSGCCQILDRLAQRAGRPYDANGALARGGSPAPASAQKIAALPYHQLDYPKSLGNAWVRETLWPLLDQPAVPPADLLHTFTRWLGRKIAADFTTLLGADAGAGEVPEATQERRVLVTGGGSHNDYLVDQIRTGAPGLTFEVPDPLIADFKEAALIALAALLRSHGRPNALPTATGAPYPTVNGALFLPPPAAPNTPPA